MGMGMASASKNNWVLPEELTVEVLRRLPVESALRFRSVSKYWKSLISDPRFARSALEFATSRRRRPLSVLFQARHRVSLLEVGPGGGGGSSSMCPLAPPGVEGCSRPCFCLGSSHGLLCFFCLCIGEFICVWNPVTREALCVPLPAAYAAAAPGFLTLYPDSWFGYVPPLDDHLIVLAARRGVRVRVHVYSMRKGGGWEEAQGVAADWDRDVCRTVSSEAVLINGCLHRFSPERGQVFRLSLGLGPATADTIPVAAAGVELAPPTWRARPGERMFLQASLVALALGHSYEEEKLCLWQLSTPWCAPGPGDSPRLDLWVLEEYGAWGSWAKLYALDLAREAVGRLPSCVGFMPGGRAIVRDTEDTTRSPVIVDVDPDPTKRLLPYPQLPLKHSDRDKHFPLHSASYVKTMVSPFMYIDDAHQRARDWDWDHPPLHNRNRNRNRKRKRAASPGMARPRKTLNRARAIPLKQEGA